MIGRVIGSYKIVAQLGEGGMGVVYLGEHPMIGKKVAIKLLHAEYSRNADVVSRFFTEARAVNSISHENIVDIMDFSQTPEGDVYFIMELLDGESLASRLKQGTLKPPETADIAIQVASACAAAHQHHIIHRDLKPDNIFLCRRAGHDLFIKVLDFGIAKLTADDAQVAHKTQAGMALGTPAYMSPEQCAGKRDIDGRTDIYALGMILYEMLTGRTAFADEDSLTGLLIAQQTRPVQPPRALNPFLPEPLEALILKCLAKKREDRFQTMADLGTALQAFSPRTGTTFPGVPAPEATPRPPVRALTPPPSAAAAVTGPVEGEEALEEIAGVAGARRKIAIAAAAVLVLGAALAGVLTLKGNGPAAAGGTPAAAGPAGATAGATAAAPASAATPAPAAAAPAPPAKVTLRIESAPPGGQVVRMPDGTLLGTTPYAFDADRGATPLRFQVRKDGYQPAETSLVPDESRTATLALARKQAPAAPARASRPARPRREAAPRPEPARPAAIDREATLAPEF